MSSLTQRLVGISAAALLSVGSLGYINRETLLTNTFSRISPQYEMYTSKATNAPSNHVLRALEVCYFIDKNGNGVPDADEPRHCIERFARDPLSENAIIAAFVPEHSYWETKIKVVLYDVGSQLLLMRDTIDLVNTDKENSYIGKPRGVLIFSAQKYKNIVSKRVDHIHLPAPLSRDINPQELIRGRHMYAIECSRIEDNKVIHRGCFYINYLSHEKLPNNKD